MEAGRSLNRSRWVMAFFAVVLFMLLGFETHSRMPSLSALRSRVAPSAKKSSSKSFPMTEVASNVEDSDVELSDASAGADTAEVPVKNGARNEGVYDPKVQKAYEAAMAQLSDKFGDDYAAKLFRVHVGEPTADRPPTWLSSHALQNMARALQSCKVEGKRFVVAVGGHSAAAAHANLPSESYAKVAESFLDPVFKAAGIEIEVRNHAMGGQKSAPASFCAKCTYGDDVNVVSWDFGMTDGRDTELLAFFAKHIMNGPTKPTVLVGYRTGEKPINRGDLLIHFSRRGWPVGAFVNSCSQLTDILPKKGVLDEDLPEWLHRLQDLDKLAHQSSFDKYSDAARAACHGIPPHAASWHPGYREHRLIGHLFSMPMLEAIKEAFLTPTLGTLEYKEPQALTVCQSPECNVQYECRNCLYPHAPNLERDLWDIGSLIVMADDASLRKSFGEAASSTWEGGCRFKGSDPTNAPQPNCLGTVDGQGAVFEDYTQHETQFLLLSLPIEQAREVGVSYELSILLCEQLCEWGSCEDTRERLENAIFTFDGEKVLPSRETFGWCREVVKDLQKSENQVTIGIKNPTAGKTIRLNAVAWGLRAKP